jgi:DNA-binding transcriptional regulator YdaS (Cro superfamily)
MEKPDSSQALEKAIACYRTLNAFAEALGVNYRTVQQWRKNGVPEKWCVEIEKLTSGGVRCEELNAKVDWSFLRGTEAA